MNIRQWRRLVVLGASLALFAAGQTVGTAAAQRPVSGSLVDRDFGGDGSLSIKRFPKWSSAEVVNVEFGPGGRLLIQFIRGDDVSPPATARYLMVSPRGRPDFGWGKYPRRGSRSRLWGPAFDKRGNVLSVGDNAVVRTSPRGHWDRTYGTNGIARVLGPVSDLAVTDDGSAWVLSDETVTALDPMGRPVPSFGTAGVSEAAKVALPQHVKWRFYEDLVLGPLGQLYLVGIDLFEDGYVPPDYAGYPVDPGDTFVAPVVMKLLHDGRIDPTFGNAGSVNPLAVSESAYVRVLGIDRRGLVLQIDRERRTSRKKHRVTSSVVRVSPSGQRNLNFGVRGEIVIGSWLEDLTTTEHSARAYLGRDRIVTESEAWNCPPEFRAKIYDGRGRFLRRVPKDAVQFPGRCRDIQETWTDGKSILFNASTIQGRDNHTVSNELWKARFPR